MSAEETLNQVLNKVIDVSTEDIQPDTSLEQAYGVDSTEMVEIAVGLKKALNVPIGDSELKKTHTYNQILEILNTKQAA